MKNKAHMLFLLMITLVTAAFALTMAMVNGSEEIVGWLVLTFIAYISVIPTLYVTFRYWNKQNGIDEN